MDYRILSGRNSEELEKKVQNMLDRGWSPCGGPTFDSRSGEMHQALTSTTESRKAAALGRD